MTETMTLEVHDQRAHVVVTVRGEIGLTTAGRLRERLFLLVGGEHPVVPFWIGSA
jgi:hypothetical protein